MFESDFNRSSNPASAILDNRLMHMLTEDGRDSTTPSATVEHDVTGTAALSGFRQHNNHAYNYSEQFSCSAVTQACYNRAHAYSLLFPAVTTCFPTTSQQTKLSRLLFQTPQNLLEPADIPVKTPRETDRHTLKTSVTEEGM